MRSDRQQMRFPLCLPVPLCASLSIQRKAMDNLFYRSALVICLVFPISGFADTPLSDTRSSGLCNTPNQAEHCVLIAQSGSDRGACPSNEIPCMLSTSQPIAELQCAGGDGTLWCEAWTQSIDPLYPNHLTYSWSVTGVPAAIATTDVHSPLAEITCAGQQVVTVTIKTPYGLADSETLSVNCGQASDESTGGER